MLKRMILMAALFVAANSILFGQRYDSYQHKGEIGASLGIAHYFGDLNPNAKLNRLKPAAGLYYQHYLNNYIGLRLAGNYARLGYSDHYNSGSAYQLRNLSFNSDIWELNLSGTFNFFNFIPGIPHYNFTPYITAGVGIFNYNPFTYINVNGKDQKVYLRPLGTEGQNSTTPHDGKKYGSIAMAFPLSVGAKWALNENWNIFAEIGYRITTTDYIDDISTTYAGAEAFTPASYTGTPSNLWYASRLQDRSVAGNNGVSTGFARGAQRGNSLAKDSYVICQIGVSFNLNGYKCPPSFGD